MAIFFRRLRPDGQPRRWRFRLRTLLVVVLVAGIGLRWLVWHLRKEREQIALVAELNYVGIYAWQYEPNDVGRLLQALPLSAQRRLMPGLLRWTFCYSPSRISAYSITEETVPYLIYRMRHLPYLKSVSLAHGQISSESEKRIRVALPDVEVDVDQRVGSFP